MYSQTTRDIVITVTPHFIDDQSDPDENQYLWAYHIVIENRGGETVQLLNRYWHITDASGHVNEVEGPGVVGEQPVLRPGEQFDYTSGTPLATPSGIMMGHYQMQTGAGEMFEVTVPAFSLDSPYTTRTVN